MSGGHFDYKQHHINEIADSVEQININMEFVTNN